MNRPAVLVLLALISGAPLFSQPVITEFRVTAASQPTAITLGPDGACWFIEQQAQRIARITPTGDLNEYPVEHASAGLNGIATGPDGALWFTQGAVDRIGRMNTAGLVTNEFPLPSGSVPFGIVNGPDGALWFTEQGTGKIGRITPSGTITEFALPWANSQLFEITVGWGGALWFTDGSGNIGEVSTAGAFARYPLPTATAMPRGITPGPDFALWFTESATGKIGRITAGGQQSNSRNPPPGLITEYNLASATAGPQGIVFGPDGAFWFTEQSGGRVGRITLEGAITEYDLPTAGSRPYGITVGPDGALWFAESSGQIGRAAPGGGYSFTEFPTREVLTSPFGITAGPDAALWFTGSISGIVGRTGADGSLSTLDQKPTSTPSFIVLGPDGKPWYTEIYHARIGTIDTAGKRTEYPVPFSTPFAITAGPDGALWFTDATGGQIGRLTTTGSLTIFPIANAVGILGITVGPDGALWFTFVTPGNGSVGRMTTTGALTVYPIPTPDSIPSGITPGPDGALWFTENKAGKIGRITLAGVITEYAASPSPGRITTGPDGALWFSDYSNSIGRITVEGAVTSYLIPTGPNAASDITRGPDGGVWYTGHSSQRIGRVSAPSAAPPTTTRFFATNPPGLEVIVDGISYTTPKSFAWPVGSRHTVFAVPPPSPAGVRYAFSGWSDGQASVHTITTGAGPAVFVANFRVQNQISVTVLPSPAGTVTVTPASPDGYYDAGTVVQATATANAGYQFVGWEPSAGIRTNNALLVVMDRLRSIRAVFNANACAATLSAVSASFGANGGTGSFSVAADSGCYWLATTDAAWVTMDLEGSGSATRNYTVAANPGGGPRTAVLTVAGQSFTITQGLSPMDVIPSAGIAPSSVFTMRFANPDGYQNLGVMNVLIASALDGRQACYLAYSLPLNVLYLVNDAGTGLLPGLPLNGSGTLSNQQCQVDGGASSATGSGSILTLKLSITFSASFSGNKIVYLASGDQSGKNSGWEPLGIWTVPTAPPAPAPLAGVLPARSNTSGQTYTFDFINPGGAAQLTVANVLINDFLNGNRACYLAYDRALNVLYLVNDAGTAISSALTPGNPGTLSNGQCSVYGTGFTATVNGNVLRLTLGLGFTPEFNGNRVVYMAWRTASQNSGWIAEGTVTIP